MRKPLAHIEQLAHDAGARHLVLVESFIGSSQGEMSAPDALTPAASSRLKDDLVQTGWDHVNSERSIMSMVLEDVTREARRDALRDLGISTSEKTLEALSDAVMGAHVASIEYGAGEIVAQTERDLLQVIRAYNRAAIRAQMMKDARGISHSAAVMETAISQVHERQKLWFTDRAGRRIPSQKHIRRLWRMVLRDQYVTTYLLILSEHGEIQARIWHPDPKHRGYGEPISMSGEGPAIEDYEDIFHPNANALPMAVKKFEELA